MPDASTLALFSLAAVALLVIPGPAVLYIVTRSIDQGRRAGLVSMFGIHVGTLVHIGAAVGGLSAILVRSALVFSVVKYAGAAYLIFLGARRLLDADRGIIETAPRDGNLRRAFRQGVVVNVLNPKTALFFFAFLPQFVDRSRGAVWAQMLVLGGLFVVLGLVSDGTYALVSASLGDRLRRSESFARRSRYVSGLVYMGLGVGAAATGSHSSA